MGLAKVRLLLLLLAGATMQAGVTPIALEDNHVGARGASQVKLPPNSSKTESWGQWSGAQERPLGYIAAEKTVGHLLGGACSARSQETRSD